MANPNIKLLCVSNLFIREMHFEKAGDIEHGHKHPFAHVSDLRKGSVAVTVNGQRSEFKAPAYIYIDPEHEHMLEALEDDTWVSCVHAIRNGERVEDIVPEDYVPDGVTLRYLASKTVIKDETHYVG